eukprot:COSAG02_NODE_1014_length_15195_cov_11.098105_1_plen_92_part_10
MLLNVCVVARLFACDAGWQPDEFDQLHNLSKPEANRPLWMAKPTGSKNGLGIKVLLDPTEAPKKKGILVQQGMTISKVIALAKAAERKQEEA